MAFSYGNIPDFVKTRSYQVGLCKFNLRKHSPGYLADWNLTSLLLSTTDHIITTIFNILYFQNIFSIFYVLNLDRQPRYSTLMCTLHTVQ
jgi:hypothetical protein